MSKPKKGSEYKCPHGRTISKLSNKGWDAGKTVTAAFCKNNCSRYRKNTCTKFKRLKNGRGQ